MAKIIDLDIELPVIVEPVRPNTVEVGTPVVTNINSNSFDVEQIFSSEVDYYGGVYVGESADNNDDATLVKNPIIISKTITGLRAATDYYINGVALPIFGNICLGNQIKITTSASPIPGEYQLVEWGQPYQNGGIPTNDYIYNINSIGKLEYGIKSFAGNSYTGVMFGNQNPSLYRNFAFNNIFYFDIAGDPSRLTISQSILIGNDVNIELGNRYIKVNDAIYAQNTPVETSQSTSTFYWFGSSQQKYSYAQMTNENGEYIHRKFPVYVKSNPSNTGWYDIVTNYFSSQFFSEIGQDKEWED